MKICAILPHYKNYKLKTFLPAVEQFGDKILKFKSLKDLDVDYNIDFFACNGMKKINTGKESLESFLYMEQSLKPTLIKETAALRMLPDVGKKWSKFV